MARGSSKSDIFLSREQWEAMKAMPKEEGDAWYKAHYEKYKAEQAVLKAAKDKKDATLAKLRATLAKKKAAKEAIIAEAKAKQLAEDMDPNLPWTKEQLERRAREYKNSTSGFYGISPTFRMMSFGDKPYAPREDLAKQAESNPKLKVVQDNFESAAKLIKAMVEYQDDSKESAKAAFLDAWDKAPEAIKRLAMADDEDLKHLYRGGRPEGKPTRDARVQSFSANIDTAYRFSRLGSGKALSKYDRDVVSSDAVINTKKFWNLMSGAVNAYSTSNAFMRQWDLNESEYLVINPKFKASARTDNPEWMAEQQAHADANRDKPAYRYKD